MYTIIEDLLDLCNSRRRAGTLGIRPRKRAGIGDDPLSRLHGCEFCGVEPPADRRETIAHARDQCLVVVEEELLLRLPEGVAVMVRLDHWHEDDQEDWSRSQRFQEVVQSLAIGDEGVDDRCEAGIGEVGGERTEVLARESSLVRGFFGRIPESPDESTDDQLMDEIAGDPCRAG